MDINYQILHQGSSQETLVLWAPNFPVIEFRTHPEPGVSIVSEEDVEEVLQSLRGEDSSSMISWPRARWRCLVHADVPTWWMSTPDNGKVLSVQPVDEDIRFHLLFGPEHLDIYHQDLRAGEVRCKRFPRSTFHVPQGEVWFKAPESPGYLEGRQPPARDGQQRRHFR